MASLFGFELRRTKKDDPIKSIVEPSNTDGSTIISSTLANYYSVSLDLDAALKNEFDLIRRYRDASYYPDCDSAIEEIVNEAIVSDAEDKQVTLNLDDYKTSETIKKKFQEEFDNILNLLDFSNNGYDIFRTWYIDGRVYYQILVDEKNTKDGIHELRYIDPRKIKKIKDIKKTRNQNGVDVVTDIQEYYMYNDAGISTTTKTGVKLSLDSVIYVPSGRVDANTGIALSYLHKAVKPVNQLKMMEDSMVIYRITRAPERRIFYIDVGNLPKIKAEQYVNDTMNRYRNKIVYDAQTGEIRDDKKHMSMIEDFWMPRREGGKGTEITTLQGGQNLQNLEDVNYFQQKLFQSMYVPLGRLQPTQGFSLGRSSEISREEIKFGKFIQRLRKKFSHLFTDALRIQLILKGIISPEEWDDIKQFIRFDFQKDNFFVEMKEDEIMQQRLALLQIADTFTGKYFSQKNLKKSILRQTDEEIDEIEKENEEESVDPSQTTEPPIGAPDGNN